MSALKRVRCTWPGSRGAGRGVASPTSIRTDSRSGTRRRGSGSARWPSPPPGRTCGSARTIAGTSRRSAPMRPGRKQYLYHEDWRARRDRQKFDRVLRLARRLPAMRRICDRDIVSRGLTRERVLAGAGAAARSRVLPDRLGGVHGGERLVRARDDPAQPRAGSRRGGALRLRGERWPAPDPDDRGSGARPARGCAPPAEGRRARAPRLPGRDRVARRPVGGHQRLPQGARAGGHLGEGLPDVARDGADGRAPRLAGRRAHVGHVPQASGLLGRQGGGRGAREHARGLPSVLHRPPGDRPVPQRRDDRPAARAGPDRRSGPSGGGIGGPRSLGARARLAAVPRDGGSRRRSSSLPNVPTSSVWNDRHRGTNITCRRATTTTSLRSEVGQTLALFGMSLAVVLVGLLVGLGSVDARAGLDARGAELGRKDSNLD